MVVSIATDYLLRAGLSGVRIAAGARDFLFKTLETDAGAHPAPYSVGTGGSFEKHAVAHLVEALRYKPEGRGVDSR